MAEAMSANRLHYNDTQEGNDSEESSFSDTDGSTEEDDELHDFYGYSSKNSKLNYASTSDR